jgi:hypothetical protein
MPQYAADFPGRGIAIGAAQADLLQEIDYPRATRSGRCCVP